MSFKRGLHEKPFLTAEDIEKKRIRSEEGLIGLSDLQPVLERFQNKNLNRECSKCLKPSNNNRVYCYNCLIPVGKPEENILPRVKLPIKLDVLRHPKELKTKSTALHAQVLCGSEDVRTVELPEVDLLTEVDPETTLLLFPSQNATTLEETPNLDKITRVVVIDSTWQQANQVLNSPFCSKLNKRVKLKENHLTSFWRHQSKGDDHLATIEAIYYFFRERFDVLSKGQDYDGRFDNLLYIFVGQLRLIEQAKRGKNQE